MRMANILTLAATGALLFSAGCAGQTHCPCAPPGGYDDGGHDRGDRDRDEHRHDWRDQKHDQGDRDREWGDRDRRDRDRAWGDRDRRCSDRDDDDWGERGERWRGPGGAESFEACTAKKAGDECVVTRGDWEMKGLCAVPAWPEGETRLVCAPAHASPPAPGAVEAPKPPAPKPPAAKPPARPAR